jgi:cytochrome b561
LKQALNLLLLILFPVLLSAQVTGADSLPLNVDSTIVVRDSSVTTINSLKKKDSLPAVQSVSYDNIVLRALKGSSYLNFSAAPISKVIKQKPAGFVDITFYILIFVVLFLGFLRFFYTRYFNNLFRVFFNTSLRQSQLTDQLLQDKQASLFFNILFALTAGLYIYFLLSNTQWLTTQQPLTAMSACVLSVAVIYLLKFIVLKFTGWLTGYKEATNTYLFIIFLINKILSILLLPFILVIAFASPWLRYPAVLVSVVLVLLMFFLRFIRSYGLLHKQVKVSRLHFFLYIAGVEIMPLLLIYKGLMVLLNKNI